MDIQEITLDSLLASRERRSARQQELLSENPELTLVCMTVVMPGNVKRNPNSLIVAESATKALRETFADSITYYEEHDLVTGFEAYLLTTHDQLTAKRLACSIEDSHPLGRLFDIDIIDREKGPISRAVVNEQPRKCLICDNEARFCMRNHTHSQDEIQQRVAEIIENYVQRI